MTDELKRDAQLNEEQLEQAAGGADIGKGCVPCKRDGWGRPIRWFELSTGKRFHMYNAPTTRQELLSFLRRFPVFCRGAFFRI